MFVLTVVKSKLISNIVTSYFECFRYHQSPMDHLVTNRFDIMQLFKNLLIYTLPGVQKFGYSKPIYDLLYIT